MSRAPILRGSYFIALCCGAVCCAGCSTNPLQNSDIVKIAGADYYQAEILRDRMLAPPAEHFVYVTPIGLRVAAVPDGGDIFWKRDWKITADVLLVANADLETHGGFVAGLGEAVGSNPGFAVRMISDDGNTVRFMEPSSDRDRSDRTSARIHWVVKGTSKLAWEEDGLYRAIDSVPIMLDAPPTTTRYRFRLRPELGEYLEERGKRFDGREVNVIIDDTWHEFEVEPVKLTWPTEEADAAAE